MGGYVHTHPDYSYSVPPTNNPYASSSSSGISSSTSSGSGSISGSGLGIGSETGSSSFLSSTGLSAGSI